MSINQRLRVPVVLALAGFVLAGCAPVAATGSPGSGSASRPDPTGSPSATPSPTAATPIVALRFSGSSVQSIDSAGATVAEAPFAGGVDATVRFVSDALGAEPDVADNEAQCAGANTSYRWDGLLATAWTDAPGFVVTFSAPKSGDVRLETSGGFAPGDDVAAFAATLPETSVGRPGGTDLFLAFDVVSTTVVGDYSSPVGAVGYAPDGAILQSVATPGEWTSFLC